MESFLRNSDNVFENTDNKTTNPDVIYQNEVKSQNKLLDMQVNKT